MLGAGIAQGHRVGSHAATTRRTSRSRRGSYAPAAYKSTMHLGEEHAKAPPVNWFRPPCAATSHEEGIQDMPV